MFSFCFGGYFTYIFMQNKCFLEVENTLKLVSTHKQNSQRLNKYHPSLRRQWISQYYQWKMQKMILKKKKIKCHMSMSCVKCHLWPVTCHLIQPCTLPLLTPLLCRVCLSAKTQIHNKISSDGRLRLPSFVFQCHWKGHRVVPDFYNSILDYTSKYYKFQCFFIENGMEIWYNIG